jgi:formylmethanofuran dehydrogenase subunit C
MSANGCKRVAAVLAAGLVIAGAARADDESGPNVPAAPPPPAVIAPVQRGAEGTLTLTGDAQNRELMCTGRNVLIEGSGGRFMLHGGCRSVTVHGDANTIEAEMLPGGRVAISGDAVTLRYTPMAAGPPIVVSVSGAGSTATEVPGGAATIYTAPGQGQPSERVAH